MTRALVVAPAWPPELPPVRLVRALASSGARVTVAVERGRKPFEATGAEILALPRTGAMPTSVLLGLGTSAAKALGSSRSRSAVGTAMAGRSGMQRMEALWRLLPLAGDRWDELYVPAGPEAVPYLPALSLAAKAVVVVDRPPVEAAAGLLAAATEVRCASVALAQAASERGADAGALRVVPPPLPDPEVFRPRREGRAAPGLRLACTAPFHWSGGHDYLLVALRRLVDAGMDVTCALVDQGPEPQRLLYTVVDLGLAELGADGRPHGDRVLVHRHPSVAETADLLRRSDVFVLPAVEDRPWPELSEAQACGLPVVASDLPAIVDAAGEGGVSLLTSRDPEALAAAVASVAAGLPVGLS